MAIIKCKMCGGDLNIIEGASTAQCEYCGRLQTVPKVDDEKKLTLFARANRLRAACEFDKAAGIYEAIVADFPEEAEAYWGLVLCKFGIEYVDDPATGKKIPTCHRSSFDSILDDSDFEQAQENADPSARKVYREEAKQIEEIRKGIIAVSNNEQPYDIFICYKETDANGDRTLDSVLAQDLYTALTDKGYRVFFSRITLEDKLGLEYEPYIFAALNSAKIMLAVGTDYEYYSAVWVKNEWSRFLKLMAKDKDKHLIPCFKGIDAYDMPKEFARLQAQDLGKVGAVQDLLRGIEKLLSKQVAQEKETIVIQQANNDPADLIKQAFMFLTDGEWDIANRCCEQVLNIDPKNARAYLGKLMAELKVKNQEDLKNCKKSFSKNSNYQNAVRFGDKPFKQQLEQVNAAICKTTRKRKRNMCIAITIFIAVAFVVVVLFTTIIPNINYNNAVALMESGKYTEAIAAFGVLNGYKDSNDKIIECNYRNAVALMESGKCTEAIAAFGVLNGYKDSNDKIIECNYRNAVALMEAGKNTEAAMAFGSISNHKGAAEKAKQMWDEIAARETISAGSNHTVGFKKDGTVVAVGSNYNGQRDVSDWTDIVAISAGHGHTVGLKKDGTVVAVGFNGYGQCNVSGWTDIVAISADYYHTVGLKKDGTVVVVGYTSNGQHNASSWTDIVAIRAGDSHIVGLKKDGTVVAVGKNGDGQCDVSGWTDIVAISAGYCHTVGLKKDGTVVAVGSNHYGQCDVSGWTDIVAISAGSSHTVGLKKDGTVVVVGKNKDGQCNVIGWTDIVAISAGQSHTIGLKKDGTVVAVGDNNDGQCNVSNWTNIIKVPGK